MKSLAKMVWGNQSADLVTPLADAPARLAATVLAMARPAMIEGTPPFAARPAAAGLDPRGGHRAPLSLPLPATPYGFFEPLGGEK